MNLYRLDYLDERGVKAAPVRQMGMDYLARRASAARAYAITEAQATGREILLSKIDGRFARVLPHWIVAPNGKARNPTINRHGPRTRFL